MGGRSRGRLGWGMGERGAMTLVTSVWFRASFPALSLLFFQISNSLSCPFCGEGGGSGYGQGTWVRDWGGRFPLDQLASLSPPPRCFCGRKLCGRSSPWCQHPSLTLAEIGCHGVLPSKKHNFPSAHELGMPSGRGFAWVCA